MFKDKNFGLPKDLIESARSVMEKQLVEYNEDDYIDNPPKGMDKGTREARKKAADMGLKGPHLEREGTIKKPKKPATTSSNNLPENHVVKFTSYLKENFHINELTEEEIAWIYENEYVQWSEETAKSQTGSVTALTSQQIRNLRNALRVKHERQNLQFADQDELAREARELAKERPPTARSQNGSITYLTPEQQKKYSDEREKRYNNKIADIFKRERIEDWEKQKEEDRNEYFGTPGTPRTASGATQRTASGAPEPSGAESERQNVKSGAQMRETERKITQQNRLSFTRPGAFGTPQSTTAPRTPGSQGITPRAPEPEPTDGMDAEDMAYGKAKKEQSKREYTDKDDKRPTSGASGASIPPPPSRPTTSTARRETDSDSSGPSSSQSFASYRADLGIRRSDLKTAQSPEYRDAYERYRKAKTPKEPFSKTAYEPGGVFDDRD